MKFKDDYQEPYCAENMLPILLSDEQIEKAIEVFNNLANMIKEVIEPLIENIVPVVKKVSETILRLYPNKRVVHLALHGNPRVKKKNIKRITKWIERMKND